MSEEVTRYEDRRGVYEDSTGDWIRYEDYEKLLAKYNSVFEWLYNNEAQLVYFDSADEIKADYEGGYK